MEKVKKLVKMAKHIMKCSECSKYTMKEECCNKPTINTKPAKFSIEDHYGEYRRKAKKEQGLI